MLRIAVILISLACIAGGVAMLSSGQGNSATPLFIIGVLLAVGTVFEARRYDPKPHGQGTWEKTGERFVDPSTGKMTEVRYNPQTGERDYIDVP
jgi:hypothetical protein